MLERRRPGKHLNLEIGPAGRSNAPAAHSTSPLETSATSRPATFTAVRCPAVAEPAATTMDLQPADFRRSRREGSTARLSSTWTAPDTSVPVTTVPKPFIENARSIGQTGAPSDVAAATSGQAAPAQCAALSRPAPVRDDTATIGAPSRKDPFTRSRTSSLHNCAACRRRPGRLS